MNKPFDLEAFKAGQKALTRNGLEATFVGVCETCSDDKKLIASVQYTPHVMSFSLDGSFVENAQSYPTSKYDLVSMVTVVSRHQALIDSYNPEPQTKTVYEWMLTRHDGSITLTNTICTEEMASEVFKDYANCKKTGRSWEVEV